MRPVHLLVACHGMWGEPIHLSEMARIIRETFPDNSVDKDGIRLELLVAETNTLDSTYDGIDWGGERIAKEVMNKIEEIEKTDEEVVTRFSVVGYSLGGLLCRYIIGVLNSRNFFDTVTPVNFATFASPHIGLVKTDAFFSKLGFKLGPKMLSRTGPQFYGVDSWSPSGQPLIEALADPNGPFHQGLAKFQNLYLYGSAYGDRTVSYQTSLIERYDPYHFHETNGITIVEDEKYAPIVSSYILPDEPPVPIPPPAFGTVAYFQDVYNKPRLPPFLRLRFPYNIIIYSLLPLLIPMAFTAAYVKVSMDSKHSRRRLKQLETDESFSDRLINVLKKLDKDVEDAIADIIDETGLEPVSEAAVAGPSVTSAPHNSRPASRGSSTPEARIKGEVKGLFKRKRCTRRSSSHSSGSSTPDVRDPAKSDANATASATDNDTNPAIADGRTPGGPMLSDLQLQLIENLNQLPFHKHAAHFPGLFSSHAAIISRDLKRFDFHKLGQGVLQHWADHFII